MLTCIARRAARFAAVIVVCALLAACNLNTTPPAAISGPPLVTLLAPTGDVSYAAGVDVLIRASIANAGADIARVEFAVDDGLIATLSDLNPDAAAEFTVSTTWTADRAGERRITVTAYRADESSSAPASVTITVNADGALATRPAVTRTPTRDADAPSETNITPTRTLIPVSTTDAPAQSAPQPTATAAVTVTVQPPTSSAPPRASFEGSVNVRQGPGMEFPRIASFLAGDSTDILGVNAAGDWLRVRLGGAEGWVRADLVEVTGDLSGLPRDGAPVATAAPGAAEGINLRVGSVALNPQPPVCNAPFTVRFQVVNDGSTAAPAGAVRVLDAYAADGSIHGQGEANFEAIPAGGTTQVDVTLTVSAYYGETHTLTLIIDPADTIPERSSDDNAVRVEYVLARGVCP